MKKILILLFLLVGFVSATSLSDCGTLNADSYILSNDVWGNTTCFTINQSNVYLDCQNYVIYPSINGTGYGIFDVGKNNVTIANCVINNSVVRDDNACFFDSVYTQPIYLFNITAYHAGGANSKGIYFNDVSYVVLDNVRSTKFFGNTPIGIVGGSSNISNSVFSCREINYDSDCIGFQASTLNLQNVSFLKARINSGDSVVMTLGSGTANINNSRLDSSARCMGSGANTYVYNTIFNCGNHADAFVQYSETQNFQLINVSFINVSNITTDSSNPLKLGWWINFYVNFSNGSAASGANVSASDKDGITQFSRLSNASGNALASLFQFNKTWDGASTTRYDYNNYTFTANYTGGWFTSGILNVSGNSNVYLTLTTSTSTTSTIPQNITACWLNNSNVSQGLSVRATANISKNDAVIDVFWIGFDGVNFSHTGNTLTQWWVDFSTAGKDGVYPIEGFVNDSNGVLDNEFCGNLSVYTTSTTSTSTLPITTSWTTSTSTTTTTTISGCAQVWDGNFSGGFSDSFTDAVYCGLLPESFGDSDFTNVSSIIVSLVALLIFYGLVKRWFK